MQTTQTLSHEIDGYADLLGKVFIAGGHMANLNASFHYAVNVEQARIGNDPIEREITYGFAQEMKDGLRCSTCFHRDDVGGGECSNCIDTRDQAAQDREDHWTEEGE
jgi:hypothetical protein